MYRKIRVNYFFTCVAIKQPFKFIIKSTTALNLTKAPILILKKKRFICSFTHVFNHI